jgi:hypothetical protein
MSELIFDLIVERAIATLTNLCLCIRFTKQARLSVFCNLTELSFVGCSGVNSDAEIATLLATSNTLTQLNLVECGSSFFTSEAFTQKPIKAPLEFMTIHGHKSLNDSVLDALERCVVNTFQYLYIGNTETFTIERVLRFLKTMCASKFNTLDLSLSSYLGNTEFCEQVVECLEPLRSEPRKVLHLNCRYTAFCEKLFFVNRKMYKLSRNGPSCRILCENVCIDYFEEEKKEEVDGSTSANSGFVISSDEVSNDEYESSGEGEDDADYVTEQAA